MKKLIVVASIVILASLAVALRSADPARRHLRNAQRFLQQGNTAAAEDEFTLALGYDDTLSGARLALARLQFNDGRLAAAEANFRKAINSPAQRGSAIVELAWLLRQQGRSVELEELLVQARHLKEDDAGAQLAAHSLMLELVEQLAQAESTAAEAGVYLKPAPSAADIAREAANAAATDEAAKGKLAQIADEIRSLAARGVELLAGVSDDRARLMSAEFLRLSGEADAAARAAGELSESSDSIIAASAFMLLATLKNEAGDTEAALELLGAAYDKDPANIAAGFQLRNLLPSSDGFDSAILAIDPAGGFGVPPAAHDDYKAGISHLLRKDYPSAAAALGKVAEQHRQWMAGRIALAVCYYRMGSLDLALRELKEIEQAAPGHVAVKTALARVLLDMRSLSEAHKYAGRVLEVEPHNPAVHEIIAQGHFLSGEFAEGIEAFDRFIELCRAADPELLKPMARYSRAGATPGDTFLNANARGMILAARSDLRAAEREFRAMPSIVSVTDRNLLQQLWWVSPLANFQLARVYAKLDDAQSARSALAAGLDRLRNLALVNYALSQGLADRSGRALVARLTPQQRSLAYGRIPAIAAMEVELGKRDMLEGEHAAALAAGNRVLDSDPSHRLALMLALEARSALAKAHVARVSDELDNWLHLVAGEPGGESLAECVKLALDERANESYAIAASYARLLRSLQNAEAEYRECSTLIKRLLDIDGNDTDAHAAAAAINDVMSNAAKARLSVLEQMAPHVEKMIDEDKEAIAELQRRINTTAEALQAAYSEPGEAAIRRAGELRETLANEIFAHTEANHRLRYLETRLTRLQTIVLQARSSTKSYLMQAQQHREQAGGGTAPAEGARTNAD